MKRVFRIVILLTLVALIFSGCNQPMENSGKTSGIQSIKKKKVLKIGIDASDYPPFAIDTGSNFVGFDIDICYDVAKKMGVKPKIVKINFDDILPALEKGEIDLGIATFTITPSRNMNVMFSQPYIVTGQAILIDNSLKNSIFSYRDLNSTQYKIAYVKGYTAESAAKKFMPDSRFIEVENSDLAIKAVLNKQADALIGDLPYCSTQFAKDQGKNLTFLDEPITFEPIGIAVKSSDYHLLNWVNNYIQQIQSDGTYDKFYNTWFVKTDWVSYLR